MRASVCILTFNGEKYLEEILTSVFQQQTSFEFEVIIIDSGSSDRTLEIAKRFPVRIKRIANHAFQHGRTRNLGIQLAKGEYVVFLVQDATPATDSWLEEMIRPFEQDQNVVGVLGNQIPRPDAPPFIKRDIEGVFQSFTKGTDIVYQNVQNMERANTSWGLMIFFSDVNAAVRKAYAIRNPYEEVPYAEDQIMGKTIIENGFTKAYNPNAAVLHSHTYPINQYFFRLFDESSGLKDVLKYTDPISFFGIIPESIKGWRQDHSYIWQENRGLLSKIKWSWYALIYNISRRLAAYLVKRSRFIPKPIRVRLSMEYYLKKR
ncbi:MAG: glycosyltransferase family 2 protein [Patescibacteria group bacterium]